MNNEKLNQIFNLEPQVSKQENLPAPIETKNIDVEDDYDLARDTLRNVITKGSDALDEIIHLAKNSEHPRTYEVAGQLMKTMSEVAKDLLALQKQKQEIQKPQADQTPHPQIGQQNNIVFTGSTEDLLRTLKQAQEKVIGSSNSE
jgi:hypothetical protein